jgi:hypothetical protein
MTENSLFRKEQMDHINRDSALILQLEEKQRIKEKIIKIANVMVYVFILLYLFGIESAVIFVLPLAPLTVYMVMLFLVRSKV